jgi:serine/threonine protein phosphatase 1
LKNIYIIGDVHGSYHSLKALIEKLPDKYESKIVFAGDLLDRGKNSYEVIKLIMENSYDCVKGNHEEMLLEFGPSKENKSLENSRNWLFSCGGEETLNSYNSKDEYFKHHLFISSLPSFLEYKDYKTEDGRYLVVSHSSIGRVWHLRNSKNIDDIKEFEKQIFWSRKSSIDIKEIFNVYGHTIFPEPKINNFSAGIDLGCFHKKDSFKIPNPRLCALEFPSMKLYIQNSLENN